ncbi:MAG: hypothetical protein ACI96W_003289 [Paraglaciecola sp.]|jgi:hypothetical protein
MSKAKNAFINWKEYNEALVNRPSFTFWIDKAILLWHRREQHGGRKDAMHPAIMLLTLRWR